MIKKTSPIMFRIDKSHKSRAKSTWFGAKSSFSKDLIEDYKIRKFINKCPSCKGLDDVLIKRNGARTQVIIVAPNIGAIIGKQGEEIKNIRTGIKKAVKRNVTGVRGNAPGNDNIWVEVEEVKQPNLSANIVAYNIAKQLERRGRAASIMRETERSIMKAGALGFKVVISGRHGGADIARDEKRKAGSVPTQTIRQNIKYATSVANTTYGVMGVKVWIALGDYAVSDLIENAKSSSNEKGRKNTRSVRKKQIKNKPR